MHSAGCVCGRRGVEGAAPYNVILSEAKNPFLSPLILCSQLSVRSGDRHRGKALATDPIQRVGDLLRLEAQLLSVVHVVQLAAAAALCLGADTGDSVWGAFQDPLDLSVRRVSAHMANLYFTYFSSDGIWYENGAAVNPAYPLSL